MGEYPTQQGPKPETRCPAGCDWFDHDRNGVCFRDCARCPPRCKK